MPISLVDAVRQGRILLGDGAMGTQLQLQGLKPGACGELWNVENPGAVKAIQASYRDAGSDVILTNTFQGTRIALQRHGLADRAAELNRAAARIAREVMGYDRWVVGDIGPFGGMLTPLGEVEPEEAEAAFLEQARALVESGVDAVIIETQTALEELELAVKAARAAGAKTVIASMAFDHTASGTPCTMMGVTPEKAAKAMLDLGADVFGCNCGTQLTLDDYAAVIRAFRTISDRPIMAQPNAGQPEIAPSGVIYRETPDKMAARILELVDAGAGIIGGCCGTTPKHIELFRKALDHRLGAKAC